MGLHIIINLLKLLELYKYELKVHPLIVSICNASTVYFIGDYTCQIAIERTKETWDEEKYGSYWKPDFLRLVKMMMVGAAINGPFAYYWYHRVQPWYIGKIMTKYSPKMHIYKQAAISSFIDTFIVNWPYFGFMVALTGMIESGGSIMDGLHKM